MSYVEYLCRKNIMEKLEKLVIHLEIGNLHYYFGSLSAVFELFSSDEIGVAYGTLRNYGLNENKPYSNGKCIIRKGVLRTKESNRGNPNFKKNLKANPK